MVNKSWTMYWVVELATTTWEGVFERTRQCCVPPPKKPPEKKLVSVPYSAMDVIKFWIKICRCDEKGCINHLYFKRTIVDVSGVEGQRPLFQPKNGSTQPDFVPACPLACAFYSQTHFEKNIQSRRVATISTFIDDSINRAFLKSSAQLEFSYVTGQSNALLHSAILYMFRHNR